MRVTEILSEAFDAASAYPIEEWYQKEDDAVVAVAHDANGNEIEVIFTPLTEDDDAIDFDFTKNHSYEQTGEGDAQRVFATVLNALNHYLTNYYEPTYVLFGSKGDSRTSLYRALIKRYVSKFGYREIPYNNLPQEITDQPTPPGNMFAFTRIK